MLKSLTLKEKKLLELVVLILLTWLRGARLGDMDGFLTINQPAALVKASFWIKKPYMLCT